MEARERQGEREEVVGVELKWRTKNEGLDPHIYIAVVSRSRRAVDTSRDLIILLLLYIYIYILVLRAQYSSSLEKNG
jgi:hypothetical protein